MHRACAFALLKNIKIYCHKNTNQMNEIQLVLLALVVLAVSVVVFYLVKTIPDEIEDKEMDIIITLGIGLLILVVDKRQDRHLNEIIDAQHKMTYEMHKMIREEIKLIKDIQKQNDSA